MEDGVHPLFLGLLVLHFSMLLLEFGLKMPMAIVDFLELERGVSEER